ncbi:DUF3775 domain-containing protein [Acuticoccus sp. MNP-M23]|uniref:DUF3775 domain-containing protein n=1 Tax=Acuticoccus sp. MNP-M23 TaxID=3072793 RepID=UPI0028169439|nr:DUF3775 domain-containing protein [Acuticoccus sp. MNP-M23]WMS41109.1 DUF3775 domain-containing protein [Acuticoccus sp. MNP-M23]
MSSTDTDGVRELSVDPELVRMIVAKGRAAMFPMPDAEDDMPEMEMEIDPATTLRRDNEESLSDENAPRLFRTETAAMIDSLNVDEQAELVALVLIGRGDYEAADLDSAVSAVKVDANGPASHRLFDIELFPSHLGNGLDAWEIWRSKQAV